jgi:DDE family transposase
MRGEGEKQEARFSDVSPERRVPRGTQAEGTAERDAALRMASQIPGTQPLTVGGDQNCDTRDFVDTLREMNITPHVARNNTSRSSAMDGRTTRHQGYAISQQKRKRVQPSFGWMKRAGLLRNVQLRGIRKVSGWFSFVGAAYHRIRLRRLRAEAVA